MKALCMQIRTTGICVIMCSLMFRRHQAVPDNEIARENFKDAGQYHNLNHHSTRISFGQEYEEEPGRGDLGLPPSLNFNISTTLDWSSSY